jgi:hypothetical protein
MLSSPRIARLDHRCLALTRLAQRLLTLQPGHSLISPQLTLSVGSSISITLHAATQARRLLAFTAAGLPKRYDYALQTIEEITYDLWHAYDSEDTLRFYALRLREAGMIQSSPNALIADGANWRFVNELKRELKA